MRVVLETTDLLEILGLHLGRILRPEQVSVRLEPTLEIEIDGAVGVGDVRRASEEGAARSRLAVTDAMPKARVVDGDDLSMGDLLTYSREIEKEIQAHGRR